LDPKPWVQNKEVGPVKEKQSPWDRKRGGTKALGGGEKRHGSRRRKDFCSFYEKLHIMVNARSKKIS